MDMLKGFSSGLLTEFVVGVYIDYVLCLGVGGNINGRDLALLKY
jgi:hypothetical protein